VLHVTQQMIVLDRELLRRIASTIDYRGNFFGSTQAAARTFPCILPEFRDQCKSLSHVGLLGYSDQPSALRPG
jgi:hypothetical protein